MSPFRSPLLALSRSATAKKALTSFPLTGSLVQRYVPGERIEDAVRAVHELTAHGLHVTVDHLGEDVTDPEQAAATVEEYRTLLDQLVLHELTERTEVSLKLTALGLRLPGGSRLALDHARTICRAAHNAGTTVTLDMEDHGVTEDTLAVLRELRQDFPTTGVALQSYLYRTEIDCRVMARTTTRVRLCKGAYDEPDAVAHTDPVEVDRAFVRCLKTLLAGEGYPMIATHDPRLIEIASALVSRYGRAPGTYEFQMLYGCRPEEQKRLAAAGEKVRVYVPYGEDWYGYLTRRLAERPRNLSFFVTSMLRKS
jgi:proline dehydrogenase